MKRLVLMIIPALICGVLYISCGSKLTTVDDIDNDEVITSCDGCTLPQENLPWLKKLIDLSKTDKTGNYYGRIWLENYKGQDIFVTNMMLGSGGVMYYFFDCSGASIVNKEYEKYHNPLIEVFAGEKYAFVEVDGEDFFHSFSLKMKLDVVVYSSY